VEFVSCARTRCGIFSLEGCGNSINRVNFLLHGLPFFVLSLSVLAPLFQADSQFLKTFVTWRDHQLYDTISPFRWSPYLVTVTRGRAESIFSTRLALAPFVPAGLRCCPLVVEHPSGGHRQAGSPRASNQRFWLTLPTNPTSLPPFVLTFGRLPPVMWLPRVDGHRIWCLSSCSRQWFIPP